MNIIHGISMSLIISSLLASAGCGSGGGGDGGGAEGGGIPPPAVTTLGTADLMGTKVTVSAASTLTPGASADFTVQLGSGGVGTPGSVEVLFGDDYDTAVPATTVAANGPNRWSARVQLPRKLTAGSGVLVRIMLTDGNILESGQGDFLVASH